MERLYRNSFPSFILPLPSPIRFIWTTAIILHLSIVSFAQDEESPVPDGNVGIDEGVTDGIDVIDPVAEEISANRCPVFDCESSATEAVGCTNAEDYRSDCHCGHVTSYQSLVSSCMLTDHSTGCDTFDWGNASSSLSTDCDFASSYSPIGLCDECYTAAVTNVSCIDNADVACLCEQQSDDFLSEFTSCVDATSVFDLHCPAAYQSILEAKFEASCSYWSEIPSSIPGCTKCQTQILEEAQCIGQYDYTCHCAVTSYLSLLTACINAECPDGEDMDIARNEHSAMCAVITSGDAASATLPGSKPKSQDSEPTSGDTGPSDGDDDDDDNNDDDEGPEMTTVIGVVAGSVAGLSILLIGGYFLFRKRSKRMSKKKSKPPILPPRPPTQQQDANGIREMWVSQQRPYHYQPNQPPLPYRPTQPSELHGQPPGAPQNGYFELGPSRF